MDRRWLLWVVGWTLALHAIGMARSALPAQDGLKFLRIAREFQTEPWFETIQGADQHPLYSIVLAVVQPAVASIAPSVADSWRITGQLVSLTAYLLTLVPLYRLSRLWIDARSATLAVFLFLMMPMPAETGRDVLSDSLALALFSWALLCGLEGFSETHPIKRWSKTAISGLLIGLGYWTRPEVAVVLPALIGVGWSRPKQWLLLTIIALALILAYVWCKGELTQKREHSPSTRSTKRLSLPSEWQDPQWDFSPKEESIAQEPTHSQSRWIMAITMLANRYGETMAWVLGPLAIAGAWRRRRMIATRGVWLAIFGFSCVLIWHSARRGYLSNRHVMIPIFLAMPWAAWSVRTLHSVGLRRGFRQPKLRRLASAVAVASLVVSASWVQTLPSHPTRWGHYAAGRWLLDHAGQYETSLDTRGWAHFTAGRWEYDYWHVRQALTDSRLTYIVTESAEIMADSKRGRTLKTLLQRYGEEVASFPRRQGEKGRSVLIYRFDTQGFWRRSGAGS